jgi:hypothetical protein
MKRGTFQQQFQRTIAAGFAFAGELLREKIKKVVDKRENTDDLTGVVKEQYLGTYLVQIPSDLSAGSGGHYT